MAFGSRGGVAYKPWAVLRGFLNANALADIYADPAKRALTKPETLWEIESGMGLTAGQIHAASVIRSEWYIAAARLFQTFDTLGLPSAQVWPFPVDWRWPQSINDQAMDTYHRWNEVVIPVSLIGRPCLSVPVGLGAQGLPMGMQIAGRFGADAKVLATGQAHRLATDWSGRRPPGGSI